MISELFPWWSFLSFDCNLISFTRWYMDWRAPWLEKWEVLDGSLGLRYQSEDNVLFLGGSWLCKEDVRFDGHKCTHHSNMCRPIIVYLENSAISFPGPHSFITRTDLYTTFLWKFHAFYTQLRKEREMWWIQYTFALDLNLNPKSPTLSMAQYWAN